MAKSKKHVNMSLTRELTQIPLAPIPMAPPTGHIYIVPRFAELERGGRLSSIPLLRERSKFPEWGLRPPVRLAPVGRVHPYLVCIYHLRPNVTRSLVIPMALLNAAGTGQVADGGCNNRARTIF